MVPTSQASLPRVKFTASPDHIFQLITNAINSSKPTGLGIYHYSHTTYTVNNIRDAISLPQVGKVVFVDYFEGRMVKLRILRTGLNTWEFIDTQFRPDYQSFYEAYQTPSDLLESFNDSVRQR